MPDRSDLSDKSDSARPLGASAALLSLIIDQLACPACLSALEMEEGRLICTACHRVYPIVDGIPVLIADHSTARNPER
jgi:uncharacterized protein YbaR (Trm112 family)